MREALEARRFVVAPGCYDALSARIAEDWADVPEDEGMAEIDAAVALERRR